MTQCNSMHVKLSNSQLKKSKSAIKSATEVALKHSSDTIGGSNNKIIFPRKLLILIDKFQSFIRILQITGQLNCLKQSNQVDFLVDFLAH